MFTEIRQAFRVLIKSPGFNSVIIVVLAIGIGSNTAVFSIVHGVLLKPLPFADSSRLVAVRSMLRSGEGGSTSFLDFADWRAQSKTFDAMAAFADNTATMTGRGDAVTLPVASTTAGLFSVLGAKPVMGRALEPADDAAGAEPVAVISEAAWDHRFGRSGSIIGEPATLDGRAAMALLLAGFGLFSVMAYSVAQRGRELGIRMALGAQPADVRLLVVTQAARLGGIGLAVGLPAALAASRMLATLLFGITPSDPLTFAGVSAALSIVLCLAAYLPARRAAHVDPVLALRTE